MNTLNAESDLFCPECGTAPCSHTFPPQMPMWKALLITVAVFVVGLAIGALL